MEGAARRVKDAPGGRPKLKCPYFVQKKEMKYGTYMKTIWIFLWNYGTCKISIWNLCGTLELIWNYGIYMELWSLYGIYMELWNLYEIYMELIWN